MLFTTTVEADGIDYHRLSDYLSSDRVMLYNAQLILLFSYFSCFKLSCLRFALVILWSMVSK